MSDPIFPAPGQVEAMICLVWLAFAAAPLALLWLLSPPEDD